MYVEHSYQDQMIQYDEMEINCYKQDIFYTLLPNQSINLDLWSNCYLCVNYTWTSFMKILSQDFFVLW